MSTFAPIQETQGERAVGIGNQQIVTPDNSYINTAVQGVGTALETLDKYGDAYAKEEVSRLTTEGQQSLDRDQKAMEEAAAKRALIQSDPNLTEVQKKAAMLESGVNQGKISRESARLRVADIVTKGIQESPLFADKMRSAATNLLGFNPESAAVQSYFGAFETNAQIQAANNKPLTKRQQAIQDYKIATGGTTAEAIEFIAKTETTQRQRDYNDARLENDSMVEREWADKEAVSLAEEGAVNMFSTLGQMAAQGEEVNQTTWENSILRAEEAELQTLRTRAVAAGKPLSADGIARARQVIKDSYQSVRDFSAIADTDFLRGEGLKRLTNLHKVYAADALPMFTFLHNSYGDRTAGRYIDLINKANGDPQQLRNLLSVSPALQPIADVLEGENGIARFSDVMSTTIRAMQNPTTKLNPEQMAAAQLIAQQTGIQETDSDKAKEAVTDLFENNNNTEAATSVILGASQELATEKQKKLAKSQWDLVAGTVPARIIDAIESHNTNSLTQRGARVVAGDKGLKLVFTDGSGNQKQAVGHPAWDSVQEINKYLRSTTRGWSESLGIADPRSQMESFANRINNTLDGSVEAREAEKKAFEDARAARQAQSTQARDLGTAQPLPTADALRDQKMQRLLELRLKAQGGS